MTPNEFPICLYREAIHLQCSLREWAWSTWRPLPNMLKLHCMAPQCVSNSFFLPILDNFSTECGGPLKKQKKTVEKASYIIHV